jgi:hypothetical protein
MIWLDRDKNLLLLKLFGARFFLARLSIARFLLLCQAWLSSEARDLIAGLVSVTSKQLCSEGLGRSRKCDVFKCLPVTGWLRWFSKRCSFGAGALGSRICETLLGVTTLQCNSLRHRAKETDMATNIDCQRQSKSWQLASFMNHGIIIYTSHHFLEVKAANVNIDSPNPSASWRMQSWHSIWWL